MIPDLTPAEKRDFLQFQRAQAAPPPPPPVAQHKVSAGEGVEAAAKQHGIAPDNLLKANPQLQNNRKDLHGDPILALGETLDIPQRTEVDDRYYRDRGIQLDLPPVQGVGQPAKPGDSVPLSSEQTVRQGIAAHYLGGKVDGKDWPTPEQAYGVSTDKLAETMANGNPLEQAALASLYGGTDPTTGKKYDKPLWEAMGISREELGRKLIESPWEVSSHHLKQSNPAAQPLTRENYEKLQGINGPLGYMMNMGVDPNTALSVQATWSAHFHGGFDPVTQSHLKPVWERWGLTSADQLTTLFQDSPSALIKLQTLVGGVDPTTGQKIAAPWAGKSSEVHGKEQLKEAQDLLGIQQVPIKASVIKGEDAELIALGFTTPSAAIHSKYVNPLQFAQSPSFRNGLEVEVDSEVRKLNLNPNGTLIVSNLMDPMGGAGLFGLVKGYPPSLKRDENGDLQAKEGQRKVKYQAHGLLQVFPENGEVVLLTKAQRIPKLLESEKANVPKGEKAKDPDSQFVKVMGHWNDAGGGVTFFVGKGDEADGSRGRTPHIVGVNWAKAPDGTIDRFGTALAAPFSDTARRANGIQFQMGKDNSGQWVPTGVGTVNEWGTNRYQFWPMITWDPNGGGITGGSIMAGTGWTLAQAGVVYDPHSPKTRLDLLGGGSDGRTPSVTYSDPSVFGLDVGGMYGKDGKALGVGFSKSESSNVQVSVDVVNGDTRAAEEKAKDLHGKLARHEISVLDLPAGVRVAASDQNGWSARGMGFYALVNAGGGYGEDMKVKTDVSRTGEDSWTVARYDEPGSNFSWNVGIYGVGPGGHYWESHMRGETLTVTAPPGPNGQPALTEEGQNALNRYLAGDGVLPGAVSLDARFQGDAARNYTSLRDGFVDADQKLKDARAKPEEAPNSQRERNRQRDIRLAEDTANNARNDLNEFLRGNLKPGDELMPGIRIQSTSTRDTEGSRPSFLIPLEAKTITRGETKTDKNTYHTFELSRRPFIGWDYGNQHAARTGANEDIFQLSSTGTVAGNAGHISHYLPMPVVDGLKNKAVYGPLWDAAVNGRDEIKGTVSIDFSDPQLVKLGQSMGQGPDGQKLWQSLANRASGAFDGQFLNKNPEYRDNYPNMLELSRTADAAAESRGLKSKENAWDRFVGNYDNESRQKLAQTFAGVTSPEAFAKLSDKEQEIFIEIVTKTSSADHSPYEALAPISAMASEDRRSFAFKGVVESVAQTEHPLFQTVNSGPGRDNKDLGSLDKGVDRITYYDDPTIEFLRFLKEDVKDPAIRDVFLGQSGFRSTLPPEVEGRRGKTIDDLGKEVSQKYTWEKTIYPVGGKYVDYLALTHDESRDMVGIIASVSEQTGSEGAWKFMKDKGVDPAQIFARLRTDDGRDQVLRQLFVDVLRPGALSQDPALRTMLDQEQAKIK